MDLARISDRLDRLERNPTQIRPGNNIRVDRQANRYTIHSSASGGKSSSPYQLHEIPALLDPDKWATRPSETQSYFQSEETTPKHGDYLIAQDEFGQWLYLIVKDSQNTLETPLDGLGNFDFTITLTGQDLVNFTAILIRTPESFEGEVPVGSGPTFTVTNLCHSTTPEPITTTARKTNDIEVLETLKVPIHLVIHEDPQDGWEWIFAAPLNGFEELTLQYCTGNGTETAQAEFLIKTPSA